MKGVKTASFANGSARRFQSEELYATNILSVQSLMLHDGKTDLVVLVKELVDRIKELEDKVASFETETVEEK
tara:strand:- start:456 stop:671 length:216 start_codon:yes stop_codon:yes gene_type:complete